MSFGEVASDLFPCGFDDYYDPQQRRRQRRRGIASISTRPISTATTSRLRRELVDTELSYPGWEQDYETAQDAILSDPKQQSRQFQGVLGMVQEKQRAYKHRMDDRINALASLDVSTYPGYDKDCKDLLAWCRHHPNGAEDVFQDKLQGLHNKSKLYRGDRSHPDIVQMDQIEFTFPGWEKEYKHTIMAHCDEPSRLFPKAFHRIRELQYLYDGNRSHWRLVALDDLQLTYPGCEEDIVEVEKWHIENMDSPENESVFDEVLEGMLEQEEIYIENQIGKEDDGGDDGDRNLLNRYYHNHHRSEEEESDDWTAYSTEESEVTEQATGRDSGTFVSRKIGSSRASRKSMGRYDYHVADGRTATTCDKSKKVKRSTRRYELQKMIQPSRMNSKSSQGKKAGKYYRPRRDHRDVLPKKEEHQEEYNDSEVGFGRCIVCRTDSTTHIFLPCGHLCACSSCSKHALSIASRCPACGQQAHRAQRVSLFERES